MPPDIQAPEPAPAELQGVFAQAGLPLAMLEDVMELAKKYGPEVLTAVLGYVSIYLINRGSSEFQNLKNPELTQVQKREITKNASEKIGLGGAGMAATAFAAGNPLFAYPQITMLLGTLKLHLESRYPHFERISNAMRLDVVVKAATVGMGAYVTAEHAEQVMDVLPVAGLTALGVAFSGHMRQEVYRILTLAGGSALMIGSAYSAHEAYNANNAVGAIMSIAFLALNALFTKNEWKEIQKMGGVKQVAAGACQAVWEKVQVLIKKEPK